ncbi:hypothetical protein [Candidatus Vampirococcus lugosii]|uniref:Uncharacterized protein n=1 Tax=Candidatus Vampirococcus lugosii TaxID=2789015 RepID=A0ABS5QLY5_9BACT|nr:hypothetical protein [Candidatus Vampirococcus lugosii]MBS8121974.1 hypothetical protein [Candidatus Vampirococcus lugosii]
MKQIYYDNFIYYINIKNKMSIDNPNNLDRNNSVDKLNDNPEILDISLESLDTEILVGRLTNIMQGGEYGEKEIQTYSSIIGNKILNNPSEYLILQKEFKSNNLPKEFLDSLLLEHIFDFDTKQAIVDIISKNGSIEYGDIQAIFDYSSLEEDFEQKKQEIEEFKNKIQNQIKIGGEEKINFDQDISSLSRDMANKGIDQNAITKYIDLYQSFNSIKNRMGDVENSLLFNIQDKNPNFNLRNVDASLINIFGNRLGVIEYFHEVQDTNSILCDIVNAKPGNLSEWNQVWQKRGIHGLLTEAISMTGLNRKDAQGIASIGMVVGGAYIAWKMIKGFFGAKGIDGKLIWMLKTGGIVGGYFVAKNIASGKSQEELQNNRRAILDGLRNDTVARESIKLTMQNIYGDDKLKEVLTISDEGNLELKGIWDGNTLSEKYRENKSIIAIIKAEGGEIDENGNINGDIEKIKKEVNDFLITGFTMLGVSSTNLNEKKDQKVNDIIKEFEKDRDIEVRKFAIRDRIADDLIYRLKSLKGDTSQAQDLIARFRIFAISENDFINLWGKLHSNITNKIGSQWIATLMAGYGMESVQMMEVVETKSNLASGENNENNENNEVDEDNEVL